MVSLGQNWLYYRCSQTWCHAAFTSERMCQLQKLLDSFMAPCTALTAGICLPLGLCKGTVTRVWNSQWSHELITQWGTSQSQSIFRPTNHRSAMPANWRPCFIPHWQSYYHQARTVKQSKKLLSIRNRHQFCKGMLEVHEKHMKSLLI